MSFTISRPGSKLAGSDKFELFLKKFTGEVLTRFVAGNIADKITQIRNITEGKSATFNSVGSVTGGYHTPGEEITTNTVKHGETEIKVDGMLLAAIEIYNLDEMMNHYEIRSKYSKEMANFLIEQYERKVLIQAAKAARQTTSYLGETRTATVVSKASATTDADALLNALIDAQQKFDETDVPEAERFAILKPAQYWLLVKDQGVLNKDVGGSGSLSAGKLGETAGLTPVKSNRIPSTVVTNDAQEKQDYSGDFTKTVGIVLQKEAVGTVKLLDLATESEKSVRRQSTTLVAKYAMGHGVVRPECAVEIVIP